MPFKSKAQWRACFAKNDPNWDCGEWADSTPSYKELPKKKKQEKKADSGRCWEGYEPVPGKEPYSDDSCRPKKRKKSKAGAKSKEKKSSDSTLAQTPLGQVMADIISNSLKTRGLAKESNMQGKVEQKAQEVAAAQNPANHGVPGADPNEIAKQFMALRNPGADAAAPASALPGQGLGMLQGYNQPGPLGPSMANSQLGSLPGGVTGAGRSVGEAGPMKMAAKLPYRERVELYARDPRSRILSGLYSNDRTPGVPGGGVDAGEDPEESAAREFKEEVGHLVRDVQMLDVPSFDQDWKPPYMNEKQKERAKRYSGSRTLFATGVYDPAQKETPIEPWSSKYIMPRKPSTMLKGLNLSHDDPDTADRMAARKRAVEEVIRLLKEAGPMKMAGLQKEAFNPAAVAKGFSKGWKGLSKLFGYGDEAVDAVKAVKAVNKTPTPPARNTARVNTAIGSDVTPLSPASVFPDTVEEGFEGASMLHDTLRDLSADAPHYGQGSTLQHAPAQEAMRFGHQFESTARELKNPAYVAPAAESARAHRAANPGKKFYEDISDKALDTPLTVRPSAMSAMPLAAENVTTPGRAGVRQTDVFYGHEKYNPQIGTGPGAGQGTPEMHQRAGGTHEPTHNLQTPLPEEIIEGQLLGRFADNPDYANFNAAAGTVLDIEPDLLHASLKDNWNMMESMDAVPEGMAFEDFAKSTLDGMKAQNRVGTNYAANPIEIEAASSDLRKWWWDRTGGANGGEIIETPEQINKALNQLLEEQPATHFMNPEGAEHVPASPGSWFDMFKNQAPEMQQKMREEIIDKLPGIVQNPVQDKTKYAAVQGLFAGLQKEAFNPAAVAKGLGKAWKGAKGFGKSYLSAFFPYFDEVADVAPRAADLTPTLPPGHSVARAQRIARPTRANTYPEVQQAFKRGVPVQATARTIKNPAYVAAKVDKARAHRAANPNKKFYEDISDKALDTPITGRPDDNSFVAMDLKGERTPQTTTFHYGHPSQGLDPAEAALHRRAAEHEVVHNLQAGNAIDEYNEWDRAVNASDDLVRDFHRKIIPEDPPAHAISPEFADPKLKYLGSERDLEYLGRPIEQEAAASDLAKWWWDRTGGANGGEIIETPEQIRKAIKVFTDEGPAGQFYRPGPAPPAPPAGRAKQRGVPGTWFDKYRAQPPEMQQKMQDVIIDKLPGVVQNPIQDKTKYAAVQGLFAGLEKEARSQTIGAGLLTLAKKKELARRYNELYSEDIKNILKTEIPGTKGIHLPFMNEERVDRLSGALAHPETAAQVMIPFSELHMPLAYYAKGKMPDLPEDEETESEDAAEDAETKETEKAAEGRPAPSPASWRGDSVPGWARETVNHVRTGAPINWGAYINPFHDGSTVAGLVLGALWDAKKGYRNSQPVSPEQLKAHQHQVEQINEMKTRYPRGKSTGSIFRSGGFGASPEELNMEKTNSVKTAAVLGLLAGLEKRAVLALAPQVPKLIRGGKKVMNVANRDDVGTAMSLGFPALGMGAAGHPSGGLEAQYLTGVGGRAANRVAGGWRAAGEIIPQKINNRLLRNHYNPTTQKVHKKLVSNTTRRLGNKIGGRVGGAIASKVPIAGAGVGAGLLATPINALMEGADAAGALPQWLGGTGMGNVGWSDSNEFRKHTTPGFGENARIFGYKDPTGGALDYAGSALNSWAKPVRTVANIAEGAYKLPQELYGAATSGPSAEAVQQSEDYMKKLEADGVSSRWAVGQMPGQGRRPADDPLTKRDTLYQQAIAQGMDRNAAQDHAIAGAAGFPVANMRTYNTGLEQGMSPADAVAGAQDNAIAESAGFPVGGIKAYNYGLEQGMSQEEAAAGAQRYAVALQQLQQQRQQQQQQQQVTQTQQR